MMNPTGELVQTDNEPENPRTQTPAHALKRDPIAIARGAINTIRSSQLRREEFREIIQAGNRRQQWQNASGNPIEIPDLTLIRDSPIRWDSTYLMINRLLRLAPVSLHLKIMDANALCFVVGPQSLHGTRMYGACIQV
jgi:hypothetical protein